MATSLHDLPAAAGLYPGLVPGEYFDETAAGDSQDLIAGEGRVFAAFTVGGYSGGSVTGQVQESADASNWTTAASVLVGSNSVAAVAFSRTQRYVRARLVVAGTGGTVPGAAILGQQKKQY
jgi:hypothetical protein